MTALSIQPPFPIITGADGQPLEDGYIWIGVANLPPIGNPVAVYWDAALTIPAALPVRTRGGYPVNAGTPARLYVGSDYSILVQNKNGSTLYSAPEATERYSDPVITGVSSAEVSFLQAGLGAVPTTVQAKLRETVSVKDFGAVGDGVADDTVAIQAAVNSAITVEFPDGTYLISGNITLPRHSVLVAIKPRAITIKSVANRTFLVQGAVTNTPTTAADVEFRGIAFEGVSIALADYVYWLRVIDCSFGAGTVTANTYNPLYTSNPTVAAKTKIENAEVSGNRFVNVRRAIYLYHGFGDVNVRDNYINTAAQSGIWISTLDYNDLAMCDRANVSNNTVLNIGTNATETYIVAIDVYARNATVIGNAVRNVKNVNYWEVDGIYVKAQEAVINDNEIYNGGYRSNIQTKQMGIEATGGGLLNGQIPTYSIVISGNSIYMDETGGFAGAHGGLLAGFVGKVFGGINIVTDNTLVTNNIIRGAGVGIYALNSFSMWLLNNVVIQNNTIVGNRGAYAMMWGCAGENLVVDGNKVLSPNNDFAMSSFSGLHIYFAESEFLPPATIAWIGANANYANRRIKSLTFSNNLVVQTLSLSGRAAGLYMAVSDASMGGGDISVDPGSFENVTIKGNVVKGTNDGAGDGVGFYMVDENDRYPNLNLDVSTNIVTASKTANFISPTGFIRNLRMSNHRLWVEAATGYLRIVLNQPATDSSGVTVGSQP
jgi:polygalacturonase